MQLQEHACVQLPAHTVALRERALRTLSFTLSSRKWGRFLGFHRQERRGSLSHHPIRARDGKITNCLPIMPGWNYTVRLYRPRRNPEREVDIRGDAGGQVGGPLGVALHQIVQKF
jgi:hypothetical protein